MRRGNRPQKKPGQVDIPPLAAWQDLLSALPSRKGPELLPPDVSSSCSSALSLVSFFF
jgi:hypothetical protein